MTNCFAENSSRKIATTYNGQNHTNALRRFVLQTFPLIRCNQRSEAHVLFGSHGSDLNYVNHVRLAVYLKKTCTLCCFWPHGNLMVELATPVPYYLLPSRFESRAVGVAHSTGATVCTDHDATKKLTPRRSATDPGGRCCNKLMRGTAKD